MLQKQYEDSYYETVLLILNFNLQPLSILLYILYFPILINFKILQLTLNFTEFNKKQSLLGRMFK